ncbi:MAG: class F sortase [Chloroflexi bacterium]|nr:class F sortase [Chloroflexota bacterium]
MNNLSTDRPGGRRRALGVSVAAVGSVMAVVGLVFVLYGVAQSRAPAEVGPDAETSIPRPPALDRPRPTPVEQPQSSATAAPGSSSTTPAQPAAGWATHLSIPSIGLETDVVQASIVTDERGDPEWPTVPFLAVHYVDTAPVGGLGNAVIAGHVVTLHEGNVFRDLYRVDYGDSITVDTDTATFTYVVQDLKLVPPSDVEVMDPTSDARLTLITCGGDFDQSTRTFNRRLAVTADLTSSSLLPIVADARPV